MTAVIKPIETEYLGYRFRSRLEARWAVFFTALKMDWQYEPEGFVLPSGARYLPDFKVRSPAGLVTWYEIKPPHIHSDAKFTEFSSSLCVKYIQNVRAPLARMMRGDPYDARRHHVMCPRCATFAPWDVYTDWNDAEIDCERCAFTVGEFDTEGDPNEAGFGLLETPWFYDKHGTLHVPPPDWRKFEGAVDTAALVARKARFGEGGRG